MPAFHSRPRAPTLTSAHATSCIHWPRANHCGPALALAKARGFGIAVAPMSTLSMGAPLPKEEYGDISASAPGSGNRPYAARRVCHRSRARRSARRDRRGAAMGTRGGNLIVGARRRRRGATESHHSYGSTECELIAKTGGTESHACGGRPKGRRMPPLRRRLRRSLRP